MKATLSRRILAIMLTLAMALTLIPSAFASSFSDVPDDAWYAKAVDFCFENELMKGTGEGFAPNGTVTREMAVQTLYAMAGSPATEYEAKFTDVADGAWYTPAIMWGASCGVVNGYDTGAFGVGDKVTREQMAMFFYNFATLINMPEDFASLNKFPDNADTSAWAKTAVQWAVAMGILSGKGQDDGTTLLKPKDPLTRAELASILSRFYPQAEEYIEGGICYHENTEIRDAKPATCEEPGYTGDTYCADCREKIATGEEIPALGHNYVDGFCENCGKPDPDAERTFALTQSLSAGMQVIIYNPGHEMVIKNENDNNWYLVPEAMTPTDGKFIENEPGELNDYVWTVVANEDGSLSFVNGDNMIVAWVSGTYIELTNDPNYDGADGRWNVTWTDGLAYIGHASFSNSYGPAYIECYYNANKDKTNISGYTSSNPSAKSTDFGFEFYAIGGCSNHNFVKGATVAPTCTEDGYTTYTCSKCGTSEKRDIVAALGHVDANKDSVCDRCGAPMGDFAKITDGVIANGMEIVIYNPGHGMAISNETDNNWYLVPVAITPDGDVIKAPDASLIWTVIDNGDGTYSFQSGDYMIGAWISGTYIELTNDPNYSGVDTKWVVTCKDGLFYLQSSSLSNSYGPAYIECFYNANKDKTNISGYTSGDPTAKSSDFGFEIYARGGEEACDHNWVKGETVAPTCTEEGYTTYTCSKCGASKKADTVAALGHIDEDEDGLCDRCDAPMGGEFVLTNAINDGDQVVIYNPGHGMAISNENDNNWYLVPSAVTPSDNKIADPDASIIWTVVDNGDGTFSFVNGDNAIVAWLSGTYIELTNDANYAGADGKWIVSWTDGLAYIQSSSLSNSYGPAYIECYYNANKDKTNISGYTSGDPTAKSNDFGFQFYVLGGEPIVPPAPPAGDLPFENEDCVVIYNAANGVIVGYGEDTDYDENTGEYSYWNVTTEDATVIGKALTASYDNAGTFYALIEDVEGETLVSFLDQYDYDMSEDAENPDCYYLAAEAPNTMYYDDYFYVIATDGGYLLKSYFDGSYLYIKDGMLYAGELVTDDANFIFQFASVDSDDEDNIYCTLLEGGSPVVPPVPPTPTGDFTLSETLNDGDQVVIYNPGHGMAITNANDNNWYLVPEAITPANDTITDPDGKFIWTVVDNGDGTLSFVNGSNAIVAWLSGTYIELTNDANYAGADGKWIVSWTDGLAYIQHSTLSNSYGPAYIECYYNANKDKTNISGYTSGDPTAKSNDFGFQFYVLGGEAPCTHNWEKTGETAATCTEKGSITYTCSLCGATKSEATDALSHDFGDDNICDVCGYEKPELGDSVAIFYPTDNKVMTTESYFYNNKKYELAAADATLSDGVISTDAENVALFTPIEDGEFTTFVTADGKYLSADGTNVELVDSETDNTKFVVEEAEGGVYLRCATAQYSGKPQYIEFYSNYFTVYSFNASNTGIYTFVLAPVAARCEHEWDDGEETTEATCTAAGVITYTCGLCGATKTESIEALGHDFGDDNECDRCGYTKPTGEGFVKVTDTADLSDGLYLIVYETDSIAMNGGLEKVDAPHNNIDVTITDGVIAADDATMAAAFEIKAMDGGYSIQAMGGSFISGDANKNTIKEGSSAAANSITIDADGNATVLAGGYLMFNKTSGDNNYRFRYYKTQTQQPIQLYKLNEG